jgi:hypothetical protein
VKQPLSARTLKGRGGRESVRGRRVRAATVSDGLKKRAPAGQQGNARLRHTRASEQVQVLLRQGEGAEREERWSGVGSQSQQRWVWHAIAPHTGQR